MTRELAEGLIQAINPILSRVRTDRTALRSRGKMMWSKNQALTPERLIDHFEHRVARGVCPIQEGESTTKLALLDFDSHGGETEFREMMRIAFNVASQLERSGLKAIPFRSSGGKGIHLYVIWDEPQDANSVRVFLRNELSALGYKPGTGGVVNKEIEIFPKQNSVEMGGCGSQFILPLNNKSVPLDLELELVLEAKDALKIEWPVSKAVPFYHAPPPRERQPLDAGTLQKITDMLEYIDPDEDYDQWIGVGMALHHITGGSELGLAIWDDFSAQGLKYLDYEDIEKRWNGFGKSSRPRTERYIAMLAKKGGYQENMSGELDFAAYTNDGKRKFEVVSASDFVSGQPPSWFIKGILPQAGLAMVFGASGAGKTFFVLDLILAVALGCSWRDYKVKQGNVVYIAAEGAGGFRKRLHAYSQYHSVDLNSMNLGVIDGAPNFHQQDLKEVIDEIEEYGGASLIVVDTLAQVTAGANENSGEHMGPVIANCQALQKHFKALVVLVHHSGKDAARGARGWSGIRAALDTEMEIVSMPNSRSATITKQKDGEDKIEFAFKLETVNLGEDEDGDPVTSCVVLHVEGHKKELLPKGKWQVKVYDAIMTLSMFDDNPIPVESIITKAVENEPYDNHSGKRDSRRESANRALGQLQKRTIIEINNNAVPLPQVRTSPQT